MFSTGITVNVMIIKLFTLLLIKTSNLSGMEKLCSSKIRCGTVSSIVHFI